MSILQSIALALGFIGMTWLFTVIGKGFRMLGRKRRARNAVAIDKRVELELSADEQLLWVDSARAHPFIGVVLVFVGFLVFSFFTAIVVVMLCEPPKEGAQTGAALAGCIPTACFGLFVLYSGIYAAFMQGKRYYFVTSKRMAFRLVSWTGRRIARDVKPSQIKNVELIDFRVNGIHVQDRVRVVFDDGEGNTRNETILPERDPECFAKAILTLSHHATVARVEETVG